MATFLMPLPDPEDVAKKIVLDTPPTNPKLLSLLANLSANNRFIYKPGDVAIKLNDPSSTTHNLSLQLHVNNYEPETQTRPVDYISNLLEQSRISSECSPVLAQINSGDEIMDDSICSTSRRREGIFSIKNNLEHGSLYPKPETPRKKKIRELVRRKSCHCTCCGGLSTLESRTLHLPQDLIRKFKKEEDEEELDLPRRVELDRTGKSLRHYTSQSSNSLLGKPGKGLMRRVSLSRLGSNNTERMTYSDFLKPIEEMQTRGRNKTYGGAETRPAAIKDGIVPSSRKRLDTLSPVRKDSEKKNERKNTARSGSKISTDKKSIDRSPENDKTEALISSLDEFTNTAEEEARSIIKDDAPSPIFLPSQTAQPEIIAEREEKITLEVPRLRPRLKKLKIKRNSIVSMTQDHQLKAIYTAEKSAEKSDKARVQSRKSVAESGSRRNVGLDETNGASQSTERPILTTLLTKDLIKYGSAVKLRPEESEEILSAKMITYSVRKPDRDSSKDQEGGKLDKRAVSLPRLRPSHNNLQREFTETTKCYQNRVRSQEKRVGEMKSALEKKVNTEKSDYIKLSDKFSSGMVDRKAYESKAELLCEGILKSIRTSLETVRKEESETKGKKKKLKRKNGSNKSLIFLPSLVYEGKIGKKAL